MTQCKWLPDIIDMTTYTSVPKFIDDTYTEFENIYLNGPKLQFKGLNVGYKRFPERDGRYPHALFWHLTTFDYKNNKDENDRYPDMSRCERIRWPKSIVYNYLCRDGSCSCNYIKVWRMKEKGSYNTKILFEDIDYLVVLRERKGFYLLWTAYIIDQPHRKRKYIRQWDRFKI